MAIERAFQTLRHEIKSEGGKFKRASVSELKTDWGAHKNLVLKKLPD